MNKYELQEFKYRISEVIAPLREKLWRLIDINKLGVEKVELDSGCFQLLIPLNKDFFVEVALKFDHRNDLRFFFRFCQWVSFGSCPQAETIPPLKKLVPKPIFGLGKYRNGVYELGALSETYPDKVVTTLKVLISEKERLLDMCKNSTNYNPDRSLIRNFKSWKTVAKIKGISKQQGIVRCVQGISKANQEFYDNSPYLHGSNGSYAVHTPYEWVLEFRIQRLCYEVDESHPDGVNIHSYVTTKLMQQLGWERITSNRLEWLNSILANKKIEIVTYEMDKPPIYRKFGPVEFNHSWSDYIDSRVKESLNKE